MTTSLMTHVSIQSSFGRKENIIPYTTLGHVNIAESKVFETVPSLYRGKHATPRYVYYIRNSKRTFDAARFSLIYSNQLVLTTYNLLADVCLCFIILYIISMFTVAV